MYKENQRYQFQPWYIKCYRWLRWKPCTFCKSLLQYPYWLIAYGSEANDIFLAEMAIAEYHMGYYYTSEEVGDMLDE